MGNPRKRHAETNGEQEMTLIGYWPLNEDSGNTAYDASGNDNNGTINGDVNQATSSLLGQKSYFFGGTDSYIDIGNFGYTINSSGTPYSVSAWFKIPDSPSSQNVIFSLDDSGGGQMIRAYVTSSNNLTIIQWDGSNTNPVTYSGINTGQWYFVTGVWDDTNLTLYVNGEKIGTSSPSGVGTSTEYMLIGANDPGSIGGYFNGSISEVRLYNRALTSSEIQYLYEVSQRGRYVSSKKKIQNIIDLAVNSPVSGQVVSGTTSIDIEASSSAGSISSIEAEANSNTIGTGSSSPISFNWDTTTATGGSNVVEVIASDDSNNSRTEDISVIVDNSPPSVSFDNLSDGEVVSNNLKIEGSASDTESSVKNMALELNGNTLETSNKSNLSYRLETRDYSNGSYTLELTAEDGANNTKKSSINITIDNSETSSMVLDDFEDGSVSDWDVTDVDNIGTWSAVQDNSMQGSYLGRSSANGSQNDTNLQAEKTISDTSNYRQNIEFTCKVSNDTMDDGIDKARVEIIEPGGGAWGFIRWIQNNGSLKAWAGDSHNLLDSWSEGTSYHIEILYNGDGTWDIYVDGTYQGTATGISGDGFIGVMVENGIYSSGGSRTMEIDYIRMWD
ncbi:MAG: hypothetical protein ACI8Z7_000674 [Candidatus Nanohaloarchaea archaeon]|jgi:hypothetical protein